MLHSSLMGSLAKGFMRKVCGHCRGNVLKIRFIASGKGAEILQISFEPGFGAYQSLAQKIKVPFSAIFCFFLQERLVGMSQRVFDHREKFRGLEPPDPTSVLPSPWSPSAPFTRVNR